MLMSRADFKQMLGIRELPSLHLEVSLGCNISCAMCTFHDGLKKFQWMPAERLKTVKQGFDCFGQVHIGDGSEPLINHDIFEIIQYLRTHDITVSVQTNAKLIRNAGDAENLVRSGLTLLSISLDGVTDFTVKKIRGGLGFSEIARAIDLINEAKHRLGSDTPYLASNAVAMRCNLDELPQLATYLLDHQFRSFRVGFLELRKPNDQLVGELLIYEKLKALQVVSDIKSIIATHQNSMSFNDGLFDANSGQRRRDTCTGYKDRFYVDWSGAMTTCYGKKYLGNIFEQGLDVLIQSEDYDAYVREVTTPDNSTCALCRFCEVMSFDRIFDHFGRRAVEYYSMDAITQSIEYANQGGEVREFWRTLTATA